MTKPSWKEDLKKEILIRLIKAFDSDNFEESVRLIPYDMRPKGSDVPYRCCVYKERAILKDRTIAGMGFSIEDDDEKTLLSSYAKKALNREKPEKNPLTVLPAACKGCVPSRIHVTELCQGCIQRFCLTACRFDAVTMVNGKASIDGTKCKNCKACIYACPYNAIVKISVPCEDSCPVDAITKDEQGLARIDFDSCIACGRCVSTCPFGAVHEKSQIIDILKNIKSGKKVVAMIAPSIVGQFEGNINQLKTALLEAGFSDVYEVSSGADITTKNEAAEFKEKMKSGEKFLTTSCCAGYKELAKKHLEEILPYISSTKTPMHYSAQMIKDEIPDAVTVFVSPCIAKRIEGLENEIVDFVMNFEELDALFKAKNIIPQNCKETAFKIGSSKQGKSYGISGQVANSIKKALGDDKDLKQVLINGLDKNSIKKLASMAKTGSCSEGNLVEVMCCQGGCIGGNDTLATQKTSTKAIEELASKSKDIDEL